MHATSIFGCRLGRPDGFGCSPVGHAVLDVPLEEDHRIRVRISASLKRDRNQCAVQKNFLACELGNFPFVSSRGRGPCRPDGQRGAAPRGNRVRDDKVPKIIDASQTHTAPSARRIGWSAGGVERARKVGLKSKPYAVHTGSILSTMEDGRAKR